MQEAYSLPLSRKKFPHRFNVEKSEDFVWESCLSLEAIKSRGKLHRCLVNFQRKNQNILQEQSATECALVSFLC